MKQSILLLLFSLRVFGAPVIEYIDRETGTRVFDASGENVDFDAPQRPREFASVDEYLRWVLERFEGDPVRNERGELIDVRGAYVLRGRPKYEFAGVVFDVTNPIVSTIAGPFGHVVVGGVRYEFPIDPGVPVVSEVVPMFYSNFTSNQSCAGVPLGG